MGKVKTTKEDLENLRTAIETLDENKRTLAKKALSCLEFMEDTLKKLEKKVKKEGAVVTTTNGNGFEVTAENPAQKSYTALVGKYNAMLKTLIDLLPSDGAENNPLLEFVNRKNDKK